MENVGKVLTSSNGIPVLLIILIAAVVFLILAKLGLFSFKGKGLTVGKTEAEVRSILLKQKEFLLQYCSFLTQSIMSDLEKSGHPVSYINTNYVIEKVIDQWLGWLLVNHISDEESYVTLKTLQAKYTMLKAIGKVNSSLLQNDELKVYFESLCARSTKEIIKGLLAVYKLENK